MRQMVGAGIFENKSGSKERGRTWLEIAEVLNTDERFGDALTARGARDRFTLISRRHKAKTAKEIRSTGGGGEERSEFEVLVEDLIELNEESEKKAQDQTDTQKEKEKQEKEKALDIRKKAMETMGQTRKRTGSEDKDDEVKEKKKRRSRSDTLTWLEKKGEMDAEWRKIQLEEERAEKKERREERRQEMDLQKKQTEMQMKAQQDQQAQQSMLMQQMINMMNQQQQQLQAMFLSRPGSGN